jgi:hypothetical protein
MKKSILIPILALACIFGGALLGMRLRAALPDHQLSPETKDSVRVGMGLVATMTALLLGLLVASAKGSYDAQRKEVIHLGGGLDFLEHLLGFYGPEAAEAGEILRGLNEGLIQQLWPDKEDWKGQTDHVLSPFRALYNSISKLAPENEVQRATKAEGLGTTADLSKTCLQLYAMGDTSIATPVLIIVILWLTTIFISFGLFAPMNWTAIVSMFIAALSVSSAIFLIMELDRPFDGVIYISDAPLRNVLNRLGP